MNLPKQSNIVLDHRYFLGDFRDYSGQGNHGVGTGTNFEKRPDKHVRFRESTDLITVTDNAGLRPLQTTMFIYGDLNNFVANGDILISKRDAGGVSYSWTVTSATGMGLRVNAVTATATTNWQGAKSVAFSLGTGANKPKFYKDGVYVTDGNSDLTMFATDDANLIIGNLYSGSYGNPNPFKGVLIYNTQLTDAEIAQVHAWIMEQKTPTFAKTNFSYPSFTTGKESNLLAAWDMKSVGGKITDKTGNGYNGTKDAGLGYGAMNCSAERGPAGLPALRFNGVNSKIIVTQDVDLTSTDFSFECLFKTSTTGTNMVLMSRRTNGSYYCYFRVDSAAGYLRGVFVGVGGTVSNLYGPSTSVADGKWHHGVLAADRDGNATIYCDGVAGTPVSIAAVGSLSTYDFEFGAREAIESFNGILCAPAIWNKALSSTEVAKRYKLFAQLPVFIDTLEDANESIAAEGGTFLSNTQWQIITGTWKISRRTDKVGKQIECVTNGKLRYLGLVGASSMYTKQFELVSGTPTLTKNAANIEIDAVAGDKIGNIRLTFGTN